MTRKPPDNGDSGPGINRRSALWRMGLGLGTLALGPACRAVPECLPAHDDDDGTPASPLDHIETLVVVMLENRSFDHYLGALRLDPGYPGAAQLDGLTGAEWNPDLEGRPVPMRRLAGGLRETFNPPHLWWQAHQQFHGGRNDGFVTVAHGDPSAMTYYDREALPVLYALCDRYTVCDRWFSSVMGPTWPNRSFVHCGSSLGHKDSAAALNQTVPTIWERLAERCVPGKNYAAGSAAYYSGWFPGKVLTGEDANRVTTLREYFDDAAAGTLPSLALIDPDWDVSDDHPPGQVALGQAFLATVFQALAQSPQWPRALFVLLYDEHGGFYDHVPPPLTVDDDPEFRQLGFRVPALVAGGTVRRGYVDHAVREHLSVAATLATRYRFAPLNARMAATADLSSCIDPALVTAPASAARPELPRAEVALGPIIDAVRAGRYVRPDHPMAHAGVGFSAPAEVERRLTAWLERGAALGAVRCR